MQQMEGQFDNETNGQRTAIAVSFFIGMTYFAVAGGFYAAGMSNANSIDSDAVLSSSSSVDSIYDVGFYYSGN